MALRVYGSLAVLSARIAPAKGGALMKDAHRHEFNYDPQPGFLYVRSRAISSRTNDNFDTFPAEEIRQAWATFVGKPVFVNHHNDNHKRARGVIVDAALHEDVNPDGTPDTWVEVLMEVDAVRFPKLAKAILAGHIDRTSMGTDVAFSVCSFCGNKAHTPLEYCGHIPKLKGRRIERRTASGTRESVLVHEICYGLGFFENSLLVEEPADPTAFTFGIDTRGLSSTASIVREAMGQMGVGYHFGGGPRDTPAAQYGLAWEEGNDSHPEVQAAKKWGGWNSLPTTRFPLGQPLHATEKMLASSSINKVVSGKEPFREGYDPQIVITTEGKAYVVDGHHRAAMHTALHHSDMGAKVLDLRKRALPKNARGYRYKVNLDCGHTNHMVGSDESFLPKIGETVECHEDGNPAKVTSIDGDQRKNYNDPYFGEDWGARRAASLHALEAAFALDEFEATLRTAMPVAEPTPLTRGVPKKPKYKNPADHPGFKTLAVSPDHVMWHWDHATPEEKAHGMRWYEDAHHMANLMGSGNSDVTAGILSAYSPQASWPTNMLNAARTIRKGSAVGPGEGAMAMHQKAAQRILNGEHWSKVLTAPKTYAFAHLISTGGKDPDTGSTLNDVVIDRHALSVAAGRRITDDPEDEKASGNVLGSPVYYGHVADAYREAAKRISEKEGREVAPYQVQAATWLTRQRLNEAEMRALPGNNERLLRGRQKAQENAYHKWQGEETAMWPGALGDNMHAAMLREAIMCSECNPNYGLPTQLCGSHAMMHKSQTQFGDLPGRDHMFSVGPDSTDILFPGKRAQMDVTPAADMSGLSPSQQAAGGFCRGCRHWFFPWEHHLHNEHDHHHPHHEGSMHTHALGEQKAPPQVDTLRDDICPVCGEEDGFNGDTCQVCGFVQPPKQFRDPDVDMAQQIDLRGGDIDGGQGKTLECDNCGAQFQTGGEAHAKTTIDQPEDEEDDDSPFEDKEDDEEDDDEDKKKPPWARKNSALNRLLAASPLDPNGRNLPVPGPAAPANEPATSDAAKPDQPGKDPASNKPGEDSDQETDETDEAHLQPGDTCPTCQQGTLVEVDPEDNDEADQPSQAPGSEEFQDADDDETSPVDKATGGTMARRKEVGAMSDSPRNLLLSALREQQQWLVNQQSQIDAQGAALHRIATLAGVEKEPVFASLAPAFADLGNPADKAAEAPIATDKPTNPGSAPAAANQGVTPDATTDLSNSNVAVPTKPFTNLVDVTQAEPGTDGPPSLSDAKIETEVRVGTPDNTTTAFPIGGENSGWTAAVKNGEDPQQRFMAALNLARMRVQAGLTTQSDLAEGQALNDDESMSLRDIETETSTLQRVLDSGAQGQRQATRQGQGGVPRRGVQRVVPSLTATAAAAPAPSHAGNPMQVQPEEFNW